MSQSPKGKVSKSKEESLGDISNQKQGRCCAKVKMAGKCNRSRQEGVNIVEVHESGTQSSKTKLRNRITTHVGTN